MATYDKYEPIAGGYRAKLDAALPLTNGSFFGAVSLKTNGRVQVGTAGAGRGVCVKNVAKGPVGFWGTSLSGGTPNPAAPIGALAGDVVDVMTSGEIVGLDPTVFVAGTDFFAQANGSITATPSAEPVGHTVEAGRLVVRIAALPAAV